MKEHDEPIKGLHDYADHAAKSCTDSHGGHKNTSGNLASIGYNNEQRSDERCEQKGVYHPPLCRRSGGGRVGTYKQDSSA